MPRSLVSAELGPICMPATPAKRGGSAASSPFSKLAQNVSASPKSPRSEPRDPFDAFLVPRALEGTHHRKLRAILQDFLKEATAWEEEHTIDGIRWATQASQAWDEIHAALGTAEDTHLDRSERIIPLLLQLEDARASLGKTLSRLERHAQRMQMLVDTAHALLNDTASAHASKAFQEPMWGTWSMARFVRAMSCLSTQYDLATTHTRMLLPDLCEASEGAPHRAALATWVRLPCVHTSGISANAPAFGSDAETITGTSRHFFEHICETEVRGWT